MVVKDRWLYFKTQVLGDIKYGKLCIYVCINDRQGIDTYEDKETEIAPTAELVFSLFEDLGILLNVLICRDTSSQVQELIVAVCSWIIVSDVDVCLRVVLILVVVPVHCVQTPNEATVYYW